MAEGRGPAAAARQRCDAGAPEEAWVHISEEQRGGAKVVERLRRMEKLPPALGGARD